MSIMNELKVGTKLRLHYGDNNINNRTMEVRAVVDDDHIVMRHHTKAGWRYTLEGRCFLEMAADAGHLTVAK